MRTDSKSRFGVVLAASIAGLTCGALPASAQDNTSKFNMMLVKPTLEQCRDALARGNVLAQTENRFTVFFDTMIFVVEFAGDGMTCQAWRPISG